MTASQELFPFRVSMDEVRAALGAHVRGQIGLSEVLDRITPPGVTGAALAARVLRRAVTDRDAWLVGVGTDLGHAFGVGEEGHSVFEELASAPWHVSHEDFLQLVQDCAAPGVVLACAVAAAKEQFPYLEHAGRGHVVKRWSAYLLKRVGTVEARETLHAWLVCSDPVLRAVASEVLGLDDEEAGDE